MPNSQLLLRDPEFYKLKPSEQIQLFGEVEPDFKGLQLPEQTQFILEAKRQYDPEYLRILHQHNVNREAEAGLAGERVAQTGREWGAGMRAAGGLIGTSTPILGPVVAGVSDVAAQGMELASGARQHFNPLSTLAEAGTSAIPMGTIAKRIPALGSLKTAGLPSKAGQMIEGAILGPATVTATSLAEGRLPTAGELGMSTAIGGATGHLLGKIARKQATMPETASNRIIRALDIPGNTADAVGVMEKVKTALPIVHELNATRKTSAGKVAKIDTLERLEDATLHAKNRLWNEHIHPVIQHSGLEKIRTDDIASAMMRHFDEINIVQNRGTINRATREAQAWTGEAYTAQQLERKLQQKNAELERIYKKDQIDQNTLARTPTGYKIKEVAALRDVLYNHLERLGAPNIRELKSMYGSLDELQHLTIKRKNNYRLAEAKAAGERFPNIRLVGRSLRGLLPLAGRRGAGEAVEVPVELLNQPDALIGSAFKMMGKSKQYLPKLPAPFKAGFEPYGWQQPRGPVIDVNAEVEPSLLPIPRPPSSLSSR